MPIKQERMIAVILAGKKWEFAFRLLRDNTNMHLADMLSGKTTPQEASAAISRELRAAQPDSDEVKALDTEEMYFKLMAHRNTQEKLRHQRRKARKAGEDVPRSTAKGGHHKGNPFEAQPANPLERALQGATPAELEAYRASMGQHAFDEHEGPASASEFIDGVKAYAPKVLRGNVEVTRTVKRGENPTNDPESPPPSVDLDEDDGQGLL